MQEVRRIGAGGRSGASTSSSPLSISMVSTYPPTSCGLATFAAALTRGLVTAGAADVGVVRCLQGGETSSALEGGLCWAPGRPGSLDPVAEFINDRDVAVIQHEFGIFGPHDGAAVLDLLEEVSIPVVSTLHTVPVSPSSRQREILEALTAYSRIVVVMTEAAKERLLAGFDVDEAKIRSIPHGATRPPDVAPDGQRQKYALTWGLLGPGKGIEWVVDALAMAPLSRAPVNYRVVGNTHPKVAEREGDAYLNMLKKRVDRLGLSDVVTFDANYHSLDQLLDIVAGACVVVLPYESDDQVTSGVLVDAITAGIPVVATRFPHAEELLASGAGIVVPHRDAAAMSRAIHSVVHDSEKRRRMADRAAQLAALHDWNRVAAEYLGVANSLCGEPQYVLDGGSRAS